MSGNRGQSPGSTHSLRDDLPENDNHRRGNNDGCQTSAENVVQEDGERLVDDL